MERWFSYLYPHKAFGKEKFVALESHSLYEGILIKLTLERFWGKKWASKQKCIKKENFIRTNRIQYDDVNHGGWFTIFGVKM